MQTLCMIPMPFPYSIENSSPNLKVMFLDAIPFLKGDQFAKLKWCFFPVFILLYWSWYLLKLTCLCQNLDGVVTKFSNAELLISAMKFFKSTHGIEKQGNKWPERVAKRVNLRCQNDGHHVPRNTHRLQVGAIVFVIRHQDIAPRLVIIVLG